MPPPQAPVPETLFPRLRADEIREDMELFGRPMTRDELRKPTSEGVRSVFTFFITKLYGLTEDDLRQPAFGCLDNLGHPELQDNSIVELHFIRACQRMFKNAEYTDGFEMRDLSDPVASRFMCQMSALVNFGKFREKRVRELQEMTEEGHSMRARKEELEDLNADVDARIATIERKREAEAAKVAEEQALVDELTAELSVLHQQHVQHTKETKDAKASLQAAIDKISTLKFRVMAQTQDIEQMQAKIVSSPDRVQAEIKDLEAAVEEDKVGLADLQAQKRDVTERSLLLKKTRRDVESSRKLVEEAQVELRRAAEIEERVKEQKAKIRVFENERESIAASCAHLERQIASAEGRRERIRQQRDALGKESHNIELKISQQTRETDRQVEDAKQAIAQNNGRATELSQKMQRLVDDFEEEVAVVGRKLSVVDAKLNSFCKVAEVNNKDVDSANREALSDLQNTIRDALPRARRHQ